MTNLIFYPGILRPTMSPIDDGINALSTVFVSQWDVNERVSAAKAVAWKIIAYGISVQKTIQFNTETRLHVIGAIQTYGLDRPITWPIDVHHFVPAIAYDIDHRLSVTSQKIQWGVKQRRSSSKQVKFDTLITTYSHKAISFNDLQRIYKPGFVEPTWYNEVDAPTLHPISYQTQQTASYFQWNTAKRIDKQLTSRFNDHGKLLTRKAFAFQDLALAVVSQKAITWNLHSRIGPQKSAAWHTIGRFYTRKPSSWNVRKRFAADFATTWRLTDHVTTTVAVSWNLDKRLRKQLPVKFRDLRLVRNFQRSAFDTLVRVVVQDSKLVSSSPGIIDTPVVHPLVFSTPAATRQPGKTIANPVVRPIDYQFNPDAGQISTPGITWRTGINPSGRVVAQKAMQFNALNHVSGGVIIKWNVIKRYNLQQQMLFNIYNSVKKDIAVSWVVGPVTGLHIRQLAQVRTDFAY